MEISTDAARAADILRRGGVVAVPTETVYGLAADADNPAAVQRIFAIKGRPSRHPLIAHLSDAAFLSEYLAPNAAAAALAKAFWPGPLTIIGVKTPRVIDAVTGGYPTVGVRVPAHPLTRAVIEALGAGRAIAAPSANRFGRVSPTTAAHVLADLGADVDLVLDGGACEIGVESTIVDVSGQAPVLLRPGAIGAAALAAVLGEEVRAPGDVHAVPAPGTLASHYAPRAAVELLAPHELLQRIATLVERGERVGVISSANVTVPTDAVALLVGGSDSELARGLYAALRQADALGLDVVLAAAPTADGLGEAVADRLRRASAPRS